MNVFEDEVNNSFFTEGLFEFDSVGVFKHFEYFYFSHCSFFNDLVLLGFFEFFNGYDFLVLITAALEYDSVGAFAYESQNIILLHNKVYHYKLHN